MTKILIIGDSCKDVFIYGKCTRMCPDAPVPVFLPTTQRCNRGMASNVAENLRKLGIECDVVCNQEEVQKTRYIDEKTNHMFLRVDSNEENIGRIKNLNKELIEKYDIVIISDYDKGFLAEEDIDFICSEHDSVFVDTKKILSSWYKKAKFIKINEKEYNRTKLTISTKDNLIITLGENGCMHRGENFPVEKVEVKDMSGAGDTFLAGLVYSYTKEADIFKAIVFANECATKVVQKRGVNVV